ncbi:Glycine-rich domain-containing protein-like [Sesbania bispinosa]|nr:Glycine-rich domain-containing protein-like [Sesbania bispinosa]
MQTQQELEWAEAQKIVFSQDLIATAKQQLLFLAEIDRNRCLFNGPVLHRANYRYKYCWLPLLAKHAESPVTKDPLVVPLDCEWIWHCHRLNPVRYKTDCMELYGRILDDWNVVSSIQGTSKEETERMWKTMYPSEPYELDLNNDSIQDFAENFLEAPESTTNYDLISAVKRQTTFFYQVSRPYWNDDAFLEGAVARYKGFLHLIKRNRERSISRFCVPTYDIDLIWHSHQLHPASYCEDLMAIMGKVLEHDDTDSDRTKGQKLDVGFSETTTQWEETYGSRYWKAGAMYRGQHPPSPLTVDKSKIDAMHNISVSSNTNQNLIQLPQKMLVEVMLEIVDVRDLPSGHKGKLIVSFNKKQQDILFNTKKRLGISSESEGKQVAVFQCESGGELDFELISRSSFNFRIRRPAKILGKTSINLDDLQNVASKLPVEKWLELKSAANWPKPISIRIGLSLTPPFPAPYELHMVSSRPFMGSYFSFMLPRKFQQANNSTNIVDEAGNVIISIQTGNLTTEKIRINNIDKEVIGKTPSGETHLLAELKGTVWSLMNSDWMLQIKKTSDEDKHVFELTGTRKVIIFPGKKLDFETKYYGNEEGNCFMTAVEFSQKDPYGKAVALMDLAYGFLEIKEEWLVLPVILSAFILSNFPDFSNQGMETNETNA